MAYKYFPHTEAEVDQMLRQCGVERIDDLYGDVPSALRHSGDYDLPPAMSEPEVRRFFEELGSYNEPLRCFIGAGCYDHFTPAVVEHIAARSEFLTSYTPYQAEVSQGTLHYIFEFQSMMTELTGM